MLQVRVGFIDTDYTRSAEGQMQGRKEFMFGTLSNTSDHDHCMIRILDTSIQKILNY
jgi:hypothetical protein